MLRLLENKINRIGLALVVVFLAMTFSASAQFIQNSSASLFSDVKAFKVGDALTVLIMEDTEAGNGTGTNQERGTDLGASLGLSGIADVNGKLGVGTSNNFKSRSSNTRNERIRSKLSVRVTNVDANGNLAIEGKRTTQVDGETQSIVIKGLVRQVDIQPNNSIYSYNILDLSLLINGKGNLTETNEPGLITKFLRILF